MIIAGIIRTRKDRDHPYKIINMTFATDARLSWETRGLMAYLLEKPDDWQVRLTDLQEQGSAGRDKLYRMLGELETCGYLTRSWEVDEQHRFRQQIITIYETPQHTDAPQPAARPRIVTGAPLPEKPYPAQPLTALPYPEKQETGKAGFDRIADTSEPFPPLPFPANPQLNKYEVKENIKQTKYEGEDSRAKRAAPSPPSPQPERSPHQSLMDAYQEALGYKIPRAGAAADAKAVKQLLADGYAEADVIACYHTMKADAFWQEKHLTLVSVSKQIGAFVYARTHPRPQRNAADQSPIPRALQDPAWAAPMSDAKQQAILARSEAYLRERGIEVANE